MSYVAAIAGIRTAIAAVTGIKRVVTGLPTSPQHLPLCYLEASSGTRTHAGQITSNTYRVIATVCVPWQDNTLAEDQIAPFINTIPAAIDAAPTLGGAVNVAWVTEWRTDVRAIGETQVRVVDFTIEVRDKGAYQATGF